MFDKIKRDHLRDEINRLKDKRDSLIKKNTEIKDSLNKTVNTNINNQQFMCPYMYGRFAEVEFSDDPNEPFGWKKGTVRGMIAIFVSFSACLGFVLGYIPPEFFLYIIMIVITSYFVSRAAFGGGLPPGRY